ncbi:hypothetical protein ACFLSA_00705 [Bacteroidota bacterium]
MSGKRGWESLSELEGRTVQAREKLEMGDLAGAYTLISGALPLARQKMARILRGEEIKRVWQ